MSYSVPVMAASDDNGGTIYDFLGKITPGISEGGLIVIAICIVICLVLFYFGRVLSNRLKSVLEAANGARAEAAEAKVGINNGHKTNIRDDIDGNHTAVESRLDLMLVELGELRKDIGGVRSDVREIHRAATDDRRAALAVSEKLDRHIEDSTTRSS